MARFKAVLVACRLLSCPVCAGRGALCAPETGVLAGNGLCLGRASSVRKTLFHPLVSRPWPACLYRKVPPRLKLLNGTEVS